MLPVIASNSNLEAIFAPFPYTFPSNINNYYKTEKYCYHCL